MSCNRGDSVCTSTVDSLSTLFTSLFSDNMSLFPEKKARENVANVRFSKSQMYWNFTRITLKVTVSYDLVGFRHNNCLIRVQRRSCTGLEYLFLLSWSQKHSVVSRLMLKHSPERWSLAPQLSCHHPILLQTPSSHTCYLNVIYKILRIKVNILFRPTVLITSWWSFSS